LYKNPEEKIYLEKLRPFCHAVYFCQRSPHPWTIRNIFSSIFSLKPFLIVRNYSQEAESILNQLLEHKKFDIIHAETFYIMPHLPKTNVPIFLLEQTIEYQVYQHFVNSLPFFIKPLFSLDILKLKIWEKNYWRKAYMVGTVSETDKEIINGLEKEIKPVIIPNGAGEDMIADFIKPKSLKKPTVLFQGNFFWLQNTEAANYLINKIIPLAKKTIPKVKFVIAGQNADKKIGKIKRENLEIIDIAPDQNDKVKIIYESADLFIAPIFGPGGTRLKILAAMAAGIPVISTKTGVTGLDIKNNNNVIIADSPNDFINSIETIIKNKILYEKIRKNAYELIKYKYNWKIIAGNLEAIYKTLKVVK
jgi:glycosyltransferase involved in cell wall biosynthesis